ncbi:sugar ABC transporter ATP-binding protein [uncultured Arthrobacter sp.]|uniref:sugar ABC transporter ATP-binding protein n=1 Tax=uncultured Arthrobacter sp. TaxID=114050 RepID=UPI0025F7A826|nr:sugar ABC transporter ATP-binding protein [uncultured Arthrobacter sp.]
MSSDLLDSEISTGLALEVRQVTKSYGNLVALDDVSFELRKGEAHALLGHNGAGKTTLVRTIAGQVVPDSGAVFVDGALVSLSSPRDAQVCGIAVVDQELTLLPALTVAENIHLGRRDARFFGAATDRNGKIASLLTRLGLAHIHPDTLVAELSLAERQLVEIARALSRDAQILLLDEPTATLSDVEIQRVFTVVRDLLTEGRSVIYVSHRLGEVLDLCDRVTVLRDGRRKATRPVAGMDRAGIVRLMLDEGAVEAARIPRREGNGDAPSVITARGLAAPQLFSLVDLTARAGEIVGIAGQIGSGASSVVRALAGLVPSCTGEVAVDGHPGSPLGTPIRSARAGIAFVSNDRKSEGLFLDKSITRNLVATRPRQTCRHSVVSAKRSRDLGRQLCALVGIDAKRAEDPVSSLSGGNQQKVFIGRCLEHPEVKVLLLDEPTRGVDVAGRAEIHNLVRRAAAGGAAVLFVSTEFDEVLDLADTVVTMFGGRVVATHRGSDIDASTILAETTHGSSVRGVA